MDKQLCFILDKNELYLDKVLVCFNDTPIFFVCCDAGQNYYLALCSDMEVLEYTVVEQSKKNLWRMLTQKVTMRSVLLDCDSFWLIKSGNSIEDDVVERLTKDKMDLEALPLEGAMYEKITEEDALYIDRITSEYFNEITFKENDVTLEAGEILKNFTEVLGNTIYTQAKAVANIAQYIDFGPMIHNLGSWLKTVFTGESVEEKEKVDYA